MSEKFDDEPVSVDDARLIERLAGALGPDPAPEGMLNRLEGLLAFRDVDRELVTLLQDAAAEPAGLRGTAGVQHRLAFELGDGSVSVELVPERGLLRGQVLAGEVTEVVLERLAAESRTTAVDALGRFTFDDPAAGPARLRLRGRATRPWTTDWFLI